MVALEGLNILLAEDNPTNQMVAIQMLESLGATVVLAVDGAEALDMIGAQPFDVALIDIEMPRISGVDLIREVRASDAAHSTMPLIALTAYVMREHRAAIEDAGADGIIAKPILSIEQFGEEIAKHVKRSGDLDAEPGAPAQPRRPEPSVEMLLDPNATPEIDLDVFERLFASFEGKARVELASTIATDISSAADRVDSSWRSGDLQELRTATHVLISVSGAIGANRLQKLARCLNSAGHAPNYDEIQATAPLLVGEADMVVNFVGSAIGDR